MRPFKNRELPGRIFRFLAPLLDLKHPTAPIRYLRYFWQWRRYKILGGKARLADGHPCLFDDSEHTPFDSHYFYQAAWAARKILAERAQAVTRHVDVGSDLRFVGMISAIVPTEFIDIRPPNIHLDGLSCRGGSVTAMPYGDGEISSLSSLSVIEHVGLGRYGDPLAPLGTEAACKELCRVLAKGGSLLLSVPVGKSRECFNAHRIFDPLEVTTWFGELQLEEFAVVDDSGTLHRQADPSRYRQQVFANGLFHFVRR